MDPSERFSLYSTVLTVHSHFNTLPVPGARILKTVVNIGPTIHRDTMVVGLIPADQHARRILTMGIAEDLEGKSVSAIVEFDVLIVFGRVVVAGGC